MKRTIKALAVVTGTLLGTQGAIAEEGLYYGVSLGYSDLDSSSDFGSTSGHDGTIGGVLGYRFENQGGTSISIEGTLDLASGNLMTTDGIPADACTDNSPDWCEIDAIARIRGVFSVPTSNGIEIIGMAGLSAVSGTAEDGPGNYRSTTATGFNIGIGAQKQTRSGIARLELTYDSFSNSSPDAFDKDLDIVSLRFSFLF